MKLKSLFASAIFCILAAGCSTPSAPKKTSEAKPQEKVTTEEKAPIASGKPTVYLIGDSTVNNSTKGQMGWGRPFASLFDTNRINVQNRARGGRSSRTYYTEGLWDSIKDDLKPGDFVLMQFGTNDGGGAGRNRSRFSVKGIGDETVILTETNGVTITVHSYGWYLRQYVQDTKAKGATPIVLSLVPRNIWTNGTVGRASNDYGKWAGEIAKTESVPFIDLNRIVADHYEEIGETNVAEKFFGPNDHTHTTPEGAEFNARCVVEGIRALPDCPLKNYLRD